MSTAIPGAGFGAQPERHPAAHVPDRNYQAYQLLHIVFTVAPIFAGVDKFFHFLVNWDAYVSPAYASIVGGHVHEMMMAVGCVEIIAGIGVALAPQIFSYVVAAWLLGIIVNLCLIPRGASIPHYDVALRDFGLMLSAIALGRLSHGVHRHPASR